MSSLSPQQDGVPHVIRVCLVLQMIPTQHGYRAGQTEGL